MRLYNSTGESKCQQKTTRKPFSQPTHLYQATKNEFSTRGKHHKLTKTGFFIRQKTCLNRQKSFRATKKISQQIKNLLVTNRKSFFTNQKNMSTGNKYFSTHKMNSRPTKKVSQPTKKQRQQYFLSPQILSRRTKRIYQLTNTFFQPTKKK